MEDYLSAFFQSICDHTQLVDEVILVQVDSTDEGLLQAWNVRGITFKLLGYPLGKHLGDAPNILLELSRHTFGFQDLNDAHNALLALGGHALGLHHALDNTKNNYVLFSDPDVFILNSVDSIYLKLMEELQLDIIGIEHPHWQNQAYLHFPCVINCLVNKERLPNKEWLADQLYLRNNNSTGDGNLPKPIVPLPGRFLVPSPLPDHYHKFPNPSGLYDVGANLWLWANRWLSYGTEDGMSYSTSYHANFDLESCTTVPLLCHQKDSAQKSGAAFRRLYERMR